VEAARERKVSLDSRIPGPRPQNKPRYPYFAGLLVHEKERAVLCRPAETSGTIGDHGAGVQRRHNVPEVPPHNGVERIRQVPRVETAGDPPELSAPHGVRDGTPRSSAGRKDLRKLGDDGHDPIFWSWNG
jgi:hypothetical protein